MTDPQFVSSLIAIHCTHTSQRVRRYGPWSSFPSISLLQAYSLSAKLPVGHTDVVCLGLEPLTTTGGLTSVKHVVPALNVRHALYHSHEPGCPRLISFYPLHLLIAHDLKATTHHQVLIYTFELFARLFLFRIKSRGLHVPQTAFRILSMGTGNCPWSVGIVRLHVIKDGRKDHLRARHRLTSPHNNILDVFERDGDLPKDVPVVKHRRGV
jgi:hypothetical protein